VSDDPDVLFSRSQAAVAAGVTYNTIQLWIRAGRLHPVVPPWAGPSIKRSELLGVMRKSLAEESSTLWASRRRPLAEDGAATG